MTRSPSSLGRPDAWGHPAATLRRALDEAVVRTNNPVEALARTIIWLARTHQVEESSLVWAVVDEVKRLRMLEARKKQ